MTKKRHAKLLRALVTRVHEKDKKDKKDGYIAPNGKRLYKCVEYAQRGLIPRLPELDINTRLDWWRWLGKDTLGMWGMGDIKELKR